MTTKTQIPPWLQGSRLKAEKLLELHTYQLERTAANMYRQEGNRLNHEIGSNTQLLGERKAYQSLDFDKVDSIAFIGWRLEMLKLSAWTLDQMFTYLEDLEVDYTRVSFDQALGEVLETVLGDSFIYYHQWDRAAHFGARDSFLNEPVQEHLRDKGIDLGEFIDARGPRANDGSVSWAQGHKALAFEYAEAQIVQEMIWARNSFGNDQSTAWSILASAWDEVEQNHT